MRIHRTARPLPAIDRSPQHIPLGIGDLATVHARRRRPALVAWLRRRSSPIAAALGAAGLLGGLALYALPPEVPAYRTGETVHIGDSVLTALPAQPGVFAGDAALVLVPRPGGILRAASSAELHGRRATGICELRATAVTGWEESCAFRIGGDTVSAIDRLEVAGGPVWHRRYADGVSVSIPVASGGSVVPVPFAIGR